MNLDHWTGWLAFAIAWRTAMAMNPITLDLAQMVDPLMQAMEQRKRETSVLNGLGLVLPPRR